MNKMLIFAGVGVAILVLGVVAWNRVEPPVKKVQFADAAINRICHRYIAKQSAALPHLAITKFTNTSGETGGYADQSFNAEGVFEGVIFDANGNEVNLGIPYGTPSVDARKDLTEKAKAKLAELKQTHQTETVTWCDESEK